MNTIQKRRLSAGPIEIVEGNEIVNVRITNTRARIADSIPFLLDDAGRVNEAVLPIRAIKAMMPGLDTRSMSYELAPLFDEINRQVKDELEWQATAKRRNRMGALVS